MLDKQQQKFIDTYLQSYSVELSAIKAGYSREDALKIGLDLLSNKEINEAITLRESQLNTTVSTLKMSKERLLRTMYFLYSTAIKQGKTKEAIDILEKIANWSGIKQDEIQLEPVKLIINNLDDRKI